MKKISVCLSVSLILLSISVQAQPVFEPTQKSKCSALLERVLDNVADAYMWVAYDANFPIWRATLPPALYNRLALRANFWARIQNTTPAVPAVTRGRAFTPDEIAEIEQTLEQMKEEKPTLRARLAETLASLLESRVRPTPEAQNNSPQPRTTVQLARDLKLFSADGRLMSLGEGIILELDSTGLVVKASHERETEIAQAVRDFIESKYPGRIVTNVRLRIPETPTRTQTYVAEATLSLQIGYRVQLFEVVILPDGTISVAEKMNAPRFIYPTT